MERASPEFCCHMLSDSYYGQKLLYQMLSAGLKHINRFWEALPGTPLGQFTLLPQTCQLVGRELASHPQEPYPLPRPFGPRALALAPSCLLTFDYLSPTLKQTQKPNLNLNQHANLRTVHVCAYHCAQLLYTTKHRRVLIIFPPNLQTIITALMLSFLDGREKYTNILVNFTQYL